MENKTFKRLSGDGYEVVFADINANNSMGITVFITSFVIKTENFGNFVLIMSNCDKMIDLNGKLPHTGLHNWAFNYMYGKGRHILSKQKSKTGGDIYERDTSRYDMLVGLGIDTSSKDVVYIPFSKEYENNKERYCKQLAVFDKVDGSTIEYYTLCINYIQYEVNRTVEHQFQAMLNEIIYNIRYELNERTYYNAFKELIIGDDKDKYVPTNYTDIDNNRWFRLTSIDDANFSGIYAFMLPNGLKIGKSRNITSRLKNHRNNLLVYGCGEIREIWVNKCDDIDEKEKHYHNICKNHRSLVSEEIFCLTLEEFLNMQAGTSNDK